MEAGAALGRRLLWALPAYAAGLLGLRAPALLLALALYAGWRRRRRARERALSAAARLQRDEEAAVRAAAKRLGLSNGELPAWVSFPDVERAEWLNKVLAQAWPFFGQFMEKLLQAQVAPAIRASSPHLQSFTFTRVDMGEKPLRVLGICSHPGAHKKQILLDLNISYVGDICIDVEVKKFFCKAGVKGMQLHGTLRIILEPLLGDVPIVGALSMFFIRRPTLDINWTGMTNLLDIPGLSSLSDAVLMDAIASFLVLPNRLLVPLVPDLPEAAELRSPVPRGALRVQLRAARGLRSKDRFLGGLLESRSDPYAELRVGTQGVRSRVVRSDLDPVWDELHEFVVHEVPGQELEVEIFDKDPDQDDFLGRLKLDLEDVMKRRVLEDWFPLQEGGQGRLHLRLEWLRPLADASKLEEVLERNRMIQGKPDPPSAAILMVYLERAEELPLRPPGRVPSPMVQISVQDVTMESKVVPSSTAPVWEAAFRFFLHDPRSQEVEFQVRDDSRQSPLGALSLPLSQLLEAPGLSLGGAFPLQGAGPKSCLHLKLVLRVLFLDAPEDAVPSTPSPEPSGSAAPPRPPHASPGPDFGTEHVLRVHLLEAEALVAKDRFLRGALRGRSDPYVRVRAAGARFRSRVMREELNPRWNEAYEAIVTDIPGQDVEFELFDKDLDEDDFLGRCKVPLQQVLSSRVVDEWLPLEGVKSGRLHVKLESLSPSTSPAMLPQVLHINSLLQPPHNEELSAALLSVFLDRASELPLRKGSKPPSAFAVLSVRDVSFKTKPCAPSTAPIWDEGFSFLIKRPHAESLELQVKDEGGQPLGALSLPLPQLLASEGLSLDAWFPLAGGGPNSQVLLRAQLRVLVSLQAEASAGGSSDPQPMEEPAGGGEQSSPGGLRQRLPPTDSPPTAEAGLGQVQLSLWYHRDGHKLVAIVHGCRSLRPQGKELPDPYVSLLLLPERGRSKRKTGTQRRTLDPDFNERFEWDLSLEEASQRRLEARVKSCPSFMARDKEVLGKLCLDLAQVDLSEGGPHWYNLQDARSSP
ncbi:extended synaptotagmin-1 [Melopsittacus undulatus]|uniref:extended synaptotagmin-1 n=1 Tax=Melopsittacus undulatus TaxID=13146 RepID=UPI00146D51DF|nr:extended synaptotagmin-1 [Melopsittacus undulatus]